MLINIDEVATSALVNAIAVAGRRISAAIGSMAHRRRELDLTTARWFETYQFSNQVPELPELPSVAGESLENVLSGDEVQAALQELLAARLTDAPENSATRARDVLRLTLTSAVPDAEQYAEALASYYDDEICGLVARLEANDPAQLSQIRSDAFATRMVNVLHAIERHTAALVARPNLRTETSFLTSYRHHLTEQHGKLDPPDFDRRRRVPISDIYVPTTITKDFYPERAVAWGSATESLDVWKLADLLDRTVLLGDPGGGKTTAANVLMYHFASGIHQVPFLVTLRDYAAKDPPEQRSVVSHIEHNLETFYQSPAPPGLVDLLLLTGRAVVIFDGLDELLDTSHRIGVTTRVERFCDEYPLARVLVTSRVIGYEQARLDPRQFTVYQLGGFSDQEIAEYARKWFAHDADARPEDATTFLAESVGISDIRSNPLMLALLCILYRGEGSLPRNRAEVYEQCATLLFRKWDAQRRIHRELRAGHLLEPTLRHLAWWLFTNDSPQMAVPESGLVKETAHFLLGRGFESEADAWEAAREFVEFCRGRMWVFSDVGTTANGEKLYAFTHRTFMEFFSAAHLAYASDIPEQLASALIPHVEIGEWTVVGELSIQLKDRTSNEGGKRIFAELLKPARRLDSSEYRDQVMQFLALCLRSVDPSPPLVRELTSKIVTAAILAKAASRSKNSRTAIAGSASSQTASWQEAVHKLITNCRSYRALVADQTSKVIDQAILTGDQAIALSSLQLVASLPASAARSPHYEIAVFWESRAESLLRTQAAAIAQAARVDPELRYIAVALDLISTQMALDMPGGLGALLYKGGELNWYSARRMRKSLFSRDSPVVEDFADIGNYLISHPEPPWYRDNPPAFNLLFHMVELFQQNGLPTVQNKSAYLGALALLAIAAEGYDDSSAAPLSTLEPLGDLLPYIRRRRDRIGSTSQLPDLLVPRKFQQIFHDWAGRRVNLVGSESAVRVP